MGMGNEIEVSESEKKAISQRDLDIYRNIINQILELIFTLYSYVDNYNKSIEGSTVDSSLLKKVLGLLKPILFSSRDNIKIAMAVKIKSMTQKNFQHESSENESKIKDEEMEDTFSNSELYAIKNDIKYLSMLDDEDKDMQDEDQEEQLKKAIAMSLEETKGMETSQHYFNNSIDSKVSSNPGESMVSKKRKNHHLIELVKFFKRPDT